DAVEEVLGAAEVAGAFFADGGNEVHRCVRAHACSVNDLGQGEHGGESAAVVADPGANETGAGAPYANGGAGRKDRVEVGADDDGRDVGCAVATADHIVGRVDANVAQSDRAESLGDPCAATAFVAGGRFDFGDRDLRGDDLGVARAECAARVRERR